MIKSSLEVRLTLQRFDKLKNSTEPYITDADSVRSPEKLFRVP